MKWQLFVEVVPQGKPAACAFSTHHLLSDLHYISGVQADFSLLEVPAKHADDCCKYCGTD